MAARADWGSAPRAPPGVFASTRYSILPPHSIAGARRANLEPEQPIDIGKHVLLVVGDGNRAESLTEGPDLPDQRFVRVSAM